MGPIPATQGYGTETEVHKPMVVLADDVPSFAE
jgi:hypothetical protein